MLSTDGEMSLAELSAREANTMIQDPVLSYLNQNTDAAFSASFSRNFHMQSINNLVVLVD